MLSTPLCNRNWNWHHRALSMAIMAKLPVNPNLFSSLPSKPPDKSNFSAPSPPIPIPKYPPPLRRSRTPATSAPPENPAFKIPHRKTKYYKPVKHGDAFSPDGSDRAVVIGDSGVSYLLPGAPFEFQFSYSETPKEKPLAIREPAFLPFAPPTMPRPWTGKAPLKGKDEKQRRKIPLFDSFNPPPPGKKGVKVVEMPGPFPAGKYPKEGKSREEVLGEPLKKWEIQMMIKPYLTDNRQVNLGRDGLTHNMLELVHTHWKRRRVCKVRCRGIPTVDMNNICYHLEVKTGGKVIHRAGGVVYLFRGRNYNYRSRPQYPVMLWKPAAPVYPKLIQKAPEGLTEEEANELRFKGKKLLPIRKLAKNGIYLTLVKDVRNAFEGSQLAKIDCTGLDPSDYKKLGAKLKELVPCVLLSFDDEQILMWRGRDWKSMYPEPLSPDIRVKGNIDYSSKSTNTNKKTVISSPKMISLWKRAIESSKALLVDHMKLNPDDLLKKVEEFERIAQAAEHTYPALILSSRGSDGGSESSDGDGDYDSDDDIYDSDPFEEADFSPAQGELLIDRLVSKFTTVDDEDVY